MSEKIICDKSDLVAIADTVRAKNGTSETFSVPVLSAAAVQAIQTGGGSRDAVLYTEQVLTEEQKTQARENIGAQAVINGAAGQIVGFNANGKPVAQKAPSGDTVLFVKQNLTGAQKTQARKNIEAVKNWDELDGKPFYEDISSGDVILAESEIVYDSENMAHIVDSSLFSGEEKGLRIEFDGSVYECPRIEVFGYVLYGNVSFMDPSDPTLPDTGEPFVFINMPAMDLTGFVCPDENVHTVRIEEINIDLKKIDNKFIDSEWLATRTVQDIVGLPQTTFTFNGGTYTIEHPIMIEDYHPISCTVTWNQQEYECEVLAVGPYWLIGVNPEKLEPTGEYPFGIALMERMMIIFPIAGDETSTNTVSVTFKVKAPVTIPSGFLPLATEDTAGAMSAADKAKLDQLKNATTSADGLMSAADKTKLNSLKTYSNATASAAGLMSASDKSKLDSLKTYSNATTTAAGLMSAADKTKLDSLSTSGGGKIDTTLTVSGSAADAKVVGDRFNELSGDLEGTSVYAGLAYPGSLKWDGVIGDREYVNLGIDDGADIPLMTAYVHITDEIPTILEPFGVAGMGTVMGFGDAFEIELMDIGGGAYISDGVLIIPSDNFVLPEAEFAFPKKGVYFMAASLLQNGIDVSYQYVSAFKVLGYSFAETGGGGDASKYFEKIGGGGVSGGESVGETLTWDGTVGERPHVEMRVDMSTGAYVEYQWVYVATNTPTYEELEGITIPYQILDNGELVDKTGIAGTPDEITGLLALPNSTMVVYSDNHTAEVIPGTTVVFPKAGIYFADISLTNSEGSQQARTTSLTIPGYNFTLPVFATETREIIKYEHLPDALQFGGVMKPNDTLKWDGNTAGLYGAKYSGSGPQPLWKVSDAMPTEEMIKAASIVLTRPDGSTDTLKASDHPDMVYVTDGAAMFADGAIFVVYTAPFVTGDMEFEETGTYFIKVETATTTELTIPGSNAFGTMEYKHIDHKYLPEALQFGEITETIPGGIIAWGGDKAGREYYGGDGMYLVKVSDATPTMDDFANGAYVRMIDTNSGETSEYFLTVDGED